MEPTDAALVERCLAGSKEAYASLVRRHQDAVYNLALRWTRDRDAADDLAQEVFIRAYRKLGTYNSGYSFRNWLLTICSNQAKNSIRSAERRQRAHEAHTELFPTGGGPEDPRAARLEEALGRLPAESRAALVLKHVEGLSYEELAQVMAIGVSAAKMRVKRARDEVVRWFRNQREEGEC